MGAVYEARHRNESRVAVKVLHRAAAPSSTQLARFKREGSAANRVGHPGAVEIFDDDIDEQGVPFLVMELLAGKTVAELAEEHGGRLPVHRVLELGDQLLDVLAAAHENGILHRDIKPANLFITGAGALKVLDFGIARLSTPEHRQASTLEGTLLGTPAFSPPEQARGRLGEMDARSDVWAVGATLFTLLTGRFVHLAETTNEQLGLAMSVGAPSLSTIEPTLHPSVVAVVDRALAYDKASRWASARAMQEAIRSIVGACGGESRGIVETQTARTFTHGVATLPSESSERVRSRKWRWAIVAVPAMALAASLRLVSMQPPNRAASEGSRHHQVAPTMDAPPVSRVVARAPRDVAVVQASMDRERPPPILGANRRSNAGKRTTASGSPPDPKASVITGSLPIDGPATQPTVVAPSNLFDRRH